MGRGKFKGKPTGRRQFSTPEEMVAGTSTRPRSFKKEEVEEEEETQKDSGEESGEDSDEDESAKKKGAQGVIQIENPNLVKPKTLKAKDADVSSLFFAVTDHLAEVGHAVLLQLEKTTELSRREREELEKQRAHERYMRLQEQGKTEQARKDLDRLQLIRQQRAEAAKKREEEKMAKEQKKAEARK
ncbi:28 kDa heat/acid-stable phosphoprotein-like protein isoform X1 [Wolffia australiana]